MRKVIFAILSVLLCWVIWSQSYSFNSANAAAHMAHNAKDRSIHCCAWYTMRGLQAGGCPAIILPAQWYSWFLPMVQFEEVSTAGYVPQAGDVVVFERPSSYSWRKISQWWGHIAMYDGEQWISDFKQNRMNPYSRDVSYRIFRFKVG